MRKICFVFILLLAVGSLNAQVYERELGVRLGYTSGFTGKVIKNNSVGIEGMLGFRQGGMQLYVLLESYKNLMPHNEKVKWVMYFGGGGHMGWVNGYDRVRVRSGMYGNYWEEVYISGMVIGIDGVFGTEYTLPKAPISFKMEFKPFLEVQGFQRVEANFFDFGFGINYKF